MTLRTTLHQSVPRSGARAGRAALGAGLVTLVTLFGPPAPAGDSPDTVSTTVVLKGCLLDFDRASNLGAGVFGIMKECLVRPGDCVRSGQVIGRLLDQDIRAELELKEVLAQNDVSVRLSKAKHAQAVARLKRSSELNRMHHLSAEEFEAHRIDVEVAALSIEEATQHFRTAQLEVQQAAGVLRNREFVTPHDGVVVSVHKNPGESVTPGEAVFRVVNTDVVRVTGHLDITDAWRVRQGQTVRVIPDIPGAELSIEREVFEGKVVYVSPQLEPETRVCTIAAEVANRDNLLRSGLQARMEIIPVERPDHGGPALRAPARSVSAGATGPAPRGAGSAANDPRRAPYVTAGEALARPAAADRRAR